VSVPFLQVEEDDARRVADGGEMAGEGQPAGVAVHPEGRDVVAALDAAVEEPAGRVEGEARRIAAARPPLPDTTSCVGVSDFSAQGILAYERRSRRPKRANRVVGCPFLPATSWAVILDRMSDVTRILSAIERGDTHAAEQLLPLVYEEL